MGGRENGTSAEQLKQAFADVKDGGAAIEKLVNDHVRAVERSVV